MDAAVFLIVVGGILAVTIAICGMPSVRSAGF